MNKEKLINDITSYLEKELANCEQAARNAHLVLQQTIKALRKLNTTR